MKNQKVWFITGASKGFGFEITKAALAAGNKVIATVRSNPEKLSGEFNSEDLFVVSMDVTNEAQVKKAVEDGIIKFGRLDIVVNNAGYGIVAAIEEVSDEEVKKQYGTNVFGLLNVVRATVPYLRKQGSGHIINFSSFLGYAPLPAYALYGSTKYAVEGITEGLAMELQSFGIKVTALAPGLFRTNFLDANSYVTAANPLSAYDDTMVGQLKNSPQQLHGNQQGDPVKLAKVVVELTNQENPPLHLPIGNDSLETYRKSAVKNSAEVEQWVGKFSSTEASN